MSITYRKLKGNPLSADELDQNFRELNERLEALELSESIKLQGGIGGITQEGPDITFESTTGEILARLTLPHLKFRPRGAWCAQRDYLFYDLCLFQGKTYLCNTPHKSGERFEEGKNKWDVIFSTE